MVVGVIAGTPIDTKMGVDYVKSMGYKAIGRACSENPIVQNEMQILYKDRLLEIFIRLCRELILEGAKGIFVHCNSLSGAIDLEYARKAVGVKIATPLDVYSECARNYNSLSVIAANGQSLAAIEKSILLENSRCRIFGAGILPLVNEIENGNNPRDIYERLKLKSLTDSLVAMKCEALILGCTHFPYILEEIKKDVKVPIINPSRRMIEMLFEA